MHETSQFMSISYISVKYLGVYSFKQGKVDLPSQLFVLKTIQDVLVNYFNSEHSYKYETTRHLLTQM